MKKLCLLIILLFALLLVQACESEIKDINGETYLKVLVDWEQFEDIEIASREKLSQMDISEQNEDEFEVTHVGARVIYPEDGASWQQYVEKETAEEKGVITFNIPATESADIHVAAVFLSDEGGASYAVKFATLEGIEINPEKVMEIEMDDLTWFPADWYPEEGFEHFEEGLKEEELIGDSFGSFLPIKIADPFWIGESLSRPALYTKVMGSPNATGTSTSTGENSDGYRSVSVYHCRDYEGDYSFRVVLDPSHFSFPDVVFIKMLPKVVGYPVEWEDLDVEVEFPDPVFEEVIREIIEKPEGPILHEDVIDIERLEAPDRGIASIEGIQYLNYLWLLDLSENLVEDVSFLEELESLTFINLRDNRIENIDFSFNFPNLWHLNLAENEIVDIGALSGLYSLTSLNLNYNRINDISALESLTNLSTLHLWENEITNIDSLENLTNLEGLFLISNHIVDISALANLTNLERLYLPSNQIVDIGPISALENLKELVLRSNQIEDITPLGQNEGFGTGDEIDIRWNFIDLDDKETKEIIDELEDKGVILEVEPQN